MREARRTSRTPGGPLRKGQLDVKWDTGSTLSMLLDDGDRVCLITPAPGAGAGEGREGAGPVSASSPQPAAREAALRQAGDLGRRHGRAAVYWQIGDSSAAAAREFYRELLRGIASADPAVTGLYEVPDLTARWDSGRRRAPVPDPRPGRRRPGPGRGRRGVPGRRP